MININNKLWEELSAKDIEQFLFDAEESVFFEFKSDGVDNPDLIKEISALANTYGGYIFLGIKDNKEIEGCKKWDEQRIHATIHDSLTPTPYFSVRRFCVNKKEIYIIRIEEGENPPYVTSKGKIYERISSGSFPIKDSVKLMQLYYKSEEALQRIKNKIELPLIETLHNFPMNVCGYIDIGFSVTLSERTNFQKDFYEYNFEPVLQYMHSACTVTNIARVGQSYIFSIGSVRTSDGKLIKAGLGNFIEIMMDGSAKIRLMLVANEDEKVDLVSVRSEQLICQNIYKKIFGDDFINVFVSAHKYQRLTVIKQFFPSYIVDSELGFENQQKMNFYLANHKEKYGESLIINSNRMPINGYTIIDKQYFDNLEIAYDNENLIDSLTATIYFDLGFIDDWEAYAAENIETQ